MKVRLSLGVCAQARVDGTVMENVFLCVTQTIEGPDVSA